jgi:chemotaxis protein MotB
LEENDYEDQVSVEKVEGSIYLRFREGVFFFPDSPVLKDGAYPILDSISNVILESYDLIEGIEISGHTAKITEGKPSKNNLFSWELSTDRALTVLKYIVQQCNVPQEKLSVVGYSSNKLYVEGYEEKFWAQNRRVEIRLSQRELTEEEQQRLSEGVVTPTVQPQATPSIPAGDESAVPTIQPSPTDQESQGTAEPAPTEEPSSLPAAGSTGHLG